VVGIAIMLDDNLLLSKLLELGLVDRAQADLGKSLSREYQVPLYDTLVWKNLVEEGPFVDMVAELIQIPSGCLADVDIEDAVKGLVSSEVALRYRAIPIEFRYIGGIKQLVVGMVNPKNREAIDEISSVAGQTIRPILVGPVDFSRALEQEFELVDQQKPNFDSAERIAQVEPDLADVPELDISEMELLDDDIEAPLDLSLADDVSQAEILSSDAARNFFDSAQNVSEQAAGNDLSSATGSVAEHTDKFDPVDKTAVRFGFVQTNGESDSEVDDSVAGDKAVSEDVDEFDASSASAEAAADPTGSKTGSGALGSTGTDFAMVEEVTGGELPALAVEDAPEVEIPEKTDYRAVGRTILKSGKAKRPKKGSSKKSSGTSKKSAAALKAKAPKGPKKSSSLALDDVPADVLVKALFKALIAGGLIEEDVIQAALDDVMNQK
jgi:hypothetical protein